MSTLGFNTALSALTAAQQAMQTIGHNIANAGTEGYSRQRVSLTPRLPVAGPVGFRFGTGVELAGVDRITDSLLNARIRNQMTEVGRQSIFRDHLVEVETMFGEPGAGGLSTVMGSLFSEISALSATPEDPAARAGVTQAGRTLSDTFNTVRRQLEGVVDSINAEIRSEVGQINDLISQVADLNDHIARTSLGGNTIPADLLDRQDMILRELGQHLDVTVEQLTNGTVTVSSRGQVLVGPRGGIELEFPVAAEANVAPEVRVAGGTSGFTPASGRLRALLEIGASSVDARVAALDDLAHNLILEFNRVHSTGVPLDGGFTTMVSDHSFFDANGSGTVLDDRIGVTNLPFTVEQGRLVVNISNEQTREVTQHFIDIDPALTTVGDLQNALNAIPHLSANVDALGHLHLNSEAGYRFDFSNRLPPTADSAGTFGSTTPTITGANSGPFAITNGDSFTVSFDGGAAQTVTFNSAQFANIGAATATEIAAAINSQITGGAASVVDGRVVIKSANNGSASSAQLATGTGTPLTALGLSTTLERGGDVGTRVALSGSYEGADDRTLSFVALGSGDIGVTAGLQVQVLDENGTVVGTLDVGSNYVPGTELSITDGVKVSFSGGHISQTTNDRFELELVADSDSSDFLVAAGLNSFFTGSNAEDIGISQAIADDPRNLAAAIGSGLTDNRNLLRMLGVQDNATDGLDGLSPTAFYQKIITDLGIESGRAATTLETQTVVLSALEARRDAISGVNLDEELLLMQQYEQAYNAAARYLQVMQEVNDTLAALVG